jgi:hypothetical protein
VHTCPRDLYPCQRPKHNPGSMTSADSQGKASTGSDGCTSIRGYNPRSRSRYGIGIIKNIELHRAFSRSDQSDKALVRRGNQ